MIRWERAAQTSQGKNAPAVEWAIKVTNYINTKFPEPRLQVFTARFGVLNWIYWVVDVDDLASLDAFQQQVTSDEGYQELLPSGQDLFVTGSIADKVLSTL